MDWYNDEVTQLEKRCANLPYKPLTLFYGSSSIRMWDTLATDFEGLQPVNLGFGGSTLAACVWFFDRLMAPFQPERMVIYAGDNDLGDGRQPQEVFASFQEMVTKVSSRFGDLPCYFISLKPSIARWPIVDKFRLTNSLIENEILKHPNWHYVDIFGAMLDSSGYPEKDYFTGDGLHLSEKGYALWKQKVYSSIGDKN